MTNFHFGVVKVCVFPGKESIGIDNSIKIEYFLIGFIVVLGYNSAYRLLLKLLVLPPITLTVSRLLILDCCRNVRALFACFEMLVFIMFKIPLW